MDIDKIKQEFEEECRTSYLHCRDDVVGDHPEGMGVMDNLIDFLELSINKAFEDGRKRAYEEMGYGD